MEIEALDAIERRIATLRLSPRKQEVVWCVLAGMSNKEIRDALFIQPSTLRNHFWGIYERAGITSASGRERATLRAQLILMLLGVSMDDVRARLETKRLR